MVSKWKQSLTAINELNLPIVYTC